MRHLWALAGVAVPLAALPGRALAQTATHGDKVAAEALFEDARKLAAAGKFDEACPKFAESERLDPSPATLLNLANCSEKLGLLATAWATYREAASAANAAGRADYLAIAQRHADALAPRLPRLTLSVERPADGIEVQRDGVLIARASWGIAIPIDPGPHTIHAAAPGYKPWTATVEIRTDAASAPVSVTVPPLEALPAEAPANAPAAVAGPGRANVPVAATPEGHAPPTGAPRTLSPQRIAGGVVAGVGVIGLAAGAIFAGIAKSRYDDSVTRYCLTTDKNACSASGVDERNDARKAGDAASWALGLGAAALAGGVALWLTAPKHIGEGRGAARVVVVPTPGGATVEGSF